MSAIKAKNSLNLSDLEAAFKATVAKYGARVVDGIDGGHVNHEDGLPWFHVAGGSLGYKTAEDFAQDLADAMRCRVLLSSASGSSVQGVMDFQEGAEGENGALPAIPDDGGEIDGYGDAFEPR